MKKSIKFILILLAAALVFAGCGKEKNIKGQSGDVSYELDGDGVLRLEGSGIADNIEVDREKVKKIVVDEGITELGAEVFSGMKNAQEAELPDSLTKIGEKAFEDCFNISELEIPENVKDIAENAFEGWKENQKIISEWYEGAVEYWKEWYDYWKEFADEKGLTEKGEELKEELKNKIAKWWEDWKESGKYWKENDPEDGEDGESETWFEYWKKFGETLNEEIADGEDGEEKPEEFEEKIEKWFENNGDLLKNIEDAIKNLFGKTENAED